MQITKIGQCCLLIETSGKRILTDPGRFTTAQNELENIDLILITHEHADHLHSESMAQIRANNPHATVITNESVGKVLSELDIPYSVLALATETEVCGVCIEAHEGKHVEIFGEYGQVENTGFFIDKTLYYPGDAYSYPQKPVKILALPVSGPWCALKDAVHYAIAIKPSYAFPVHDAVLTSDGMQLVHNLINTFLQNHHIDFVPMKNGDVYTFTV
jgi:L-ascorbate metabolism protein UlaG (beta-lactamase superfamily)